MILFEKSAVKLWGAAERFAGSMHGVAEEYRTVLQEALKDYKVVALRQRSRCAIMTVQEWDEFGRWPIVGEFDEMRSLMLQHGVKELAAYARALARLMHVEVEHTEWARSMKPACLLQTSSRHRVAMTMVKGCMKRN
jgi:hypothetical protein